VSCKLSLSGGKYEKEAKKEETHVRILTTMGRKISPNIYFYSKKILFFGKNFYFFCFSFALHDLLQRMNISNRMWRECKLTNSL